MQSNINSIMPFTPVWHIDTFHLQMVQIEGWEAALLNSIYSIVKSPCQLKHMETMAHVLL